LDQDDVLVYCRTLLSESIFKFASGQKFCCQLLDAVREAPNSSVESKNANSKAIIGILLYLSSQLKVSAKNNGNNLIDLDLLL
jgi:hypothetical protein